MGCKIHTKDIIEAPCVWESIWCMT